MKKVKPIAWVILCLPVLYAAIAAAAAYKQDTNLFDLMTRFSHVLKHPTLLHWTGYTPQCIIGALACYGLAVTLYYSGYENRRPGEEYGSAKWGSVRALNKKYADPKGKNAILTKRISIGLDGYRHQRNLNILVVGGSGSGKTRYFCKPGIMSANCSYLVIDPKGEMLRSTGRLLEQEKYDIKVFDLIHPQQSDGYNPFTYIRDEPDVLKLMDNLVKNTTPPKGASNDPFWEKAEIALDSALMLYLLSEAPKEEQNFEMLMFMLECARVMEEDEQYQSPLDLLFQALEEREPNHVAVREYKVYKQAAGKTAKSILISCGSRLAPFDIPQLREIMSYDELGLDRIGDRKTAVFFTISDTTPTYNFLVALAFSQMFNLLCERADNVHGGRLPHHVRVLWDEAANTGQVPNLEKLVAVIRSREISLTLFYQQMAQCKAIYDKHAETIMGNMDSVVFLGGRESSTIKEISENWLGKSTIYMQTDGRSKGQSESYNQNTQRLGRELMTPAELATMPGDRCILQLRGLPPFYSPKYDLKQHPNYKYTAEADKVKNAFSLDQLINRRRRPGLSEACEVYEADGTDTGPIGEDEDILNYDDVDDPDAYV